LSATHACWPFAPELPEGSPKPPTAYPAICLLFGVDWAIGYEAQGPGINQWEWKEDYHLEEMIVYTKTNVEIPSSGPS